MDSTNNNSDLFDPERDQGLFTIRYFRLQYERSTGDCIFFRAPDGQTMLIDSGIRQTADQVLHYLNRLGVETLDIVILTHPHTDHVGGLSRILEEKHIGKLYTINLSLDALYSDEYRDAEEVLARKRIPRHVVGEGDVFRLGSEVEIEVLNPEREIKPFEIKVQSPGRELTPFDFDYDYGSYINHHSLVCKVTFKNHSFLFSTDIYAPRERMLIEKYGVRLQSDMMHAPHHGSTSSSSVPYIMAVNPKIAVLSFHVSNPVTEEIFARYRELGVKPYQVGIHGSILLTSDGDRISVFTERGEEIRENIVG